ncbi:hypothetical protein OCU04_001531 [Sclerotinia nivalis]|uniref:Uncharacterized protein n=1 Tax=Sclerotinia nivalis TaxID=352851 RepID=A0A9X0DRY7_9HELO|nr:hypothetical protein OCU04_001531 [Sclerotinia nivalis]
MSSVRSFRKCALVKKVKCTGAYDQSLARGPFAKRESQKCSGPSPDLLLFMCAADSAAATLTLPGGSCVKHGPIVHVVMVRKRRENA